MNKGEWILNNKETVMRCVRVGIMKYEILVHAEIWKEFNELVLPTKYDKYWVLSEKYGYREPSSIRAIVKRMSEEVNDFTEKKTL